MSDIKITMTNSTHAEIGLIERRRTTAQALAASIDKWKVIAALLRGGIFVREGGPNSCGLCVKFYKKNCRGCPVRTKTKETACSGTPYSKWSRGASPDKNLPTALLEVGFLESLRLKHDPR